MCACHCFHNYCESRSKLVCVRACVPKYFHTSLHILQLQRYTSRMLVLNTIFKVGFDLTQIFFNIHMYNVHCRTPSSVLHVYIHLL